MRLAFLGLPLGALALAADGHDVRVAVLAPVDAPGRRRLARRLDPGRILDAARLSRAALDAEAGARLVAEAPELLVCWFWTRRVPAAWLRAAPLGAVNAHPSLLPRHRGPDPYFWAIDAGDSEAGASVHFMVEELDAGPVIERERVAVGERDAWQLARALDRPALRLLRDVVRRFASGERPAAESQDESLATLAPGPDGELLRVDWRWPTERVLRRIRALSPDPGLAIELGGTPIFVTRARAALAPLRALAPGEAHVQPDGVSIRTGDGAVTIVRAVSGLGSEARPGLRPGMLLGADAIAALLAGPPDFRGPGHA